MARATLLACALLCGCAEDLAAGPAHQGIEPPPWNGAAGSGDGDRDLGSGDGPCDMTGRWGMQRVTFTTPDTPIINTAQKASRWDYLEIVQDDDALEVTRGLSCGLTISGQANVNPRPEALAAMRERNAMTGRVGTSINTGAACDLRMERVYSLIGIGPADDYLPGAVVPPGRVPDDPEIDALPPLPDDAPGAEDWDQDGNPGVRFVITESPLGSSWRDAIQRTWHEITGEYPHGAGEFTMPLQWDFDEKILDAENPFSATTAFVRPSEHTVLLRRLGESFADDDDGSRICTRLRELMPHRAEPEDAF